MWWWFQEMALRGGRLERLMSRVTERVVWCFMAVRKVSIEGWIRKVPNRVEGEDDLLYSRAEQSETIAGTWHAWPEPQFTAGRLRLDQTSRSLVSFHSHANNLGIFHITSSSQLSLRILSSSHDTLQLNIASLQTASARSVTMLLCMLQFHYQNTKSFEANSIHQSVPPAVTCSRSPPSSITNSLHRTKSTPARTASNVAHVPTR